MSNFQFPMSEGRVFDLLKQREECPPMVVQKRERPTDNLGQAIYKVSQQRFLDSDEEVLALDYFIYDFSVSLDWVYKLLKHADGMGYEAQRHVQTLQNVCKLLTRATNDLNWADKILGQELEWLDSTPIDGKLALAAAKRIWYFATEFPDNYKPAIGLDYQLKEFKQRKDLNRIIDVGLKMDKIMKFDPTQYQ